MEGLGHWGETEEGPNTAWESWGDLRGGDLLGSPEG